ncbi:MAG: cation:proton antiporter [Deltaproteobacteria bacterium]|jgi:CPA2 family monovalent cation:H+ antiporter-2|nr:cation:proton antiporter [Deltaproteobacteria bacterium]
MEVALFKDVLVIFSLAIGVLLVCQRIKLPTVVGFLLTGILAGPYGFGLISAIHEVEILAEIGVVLLLFTIGVEFSLKEFVRMKKSVVLGGSLQVVLTFLLSFAISIHLGRPLNEAVFIGFFISLSSTAIVLKILQEKAQFDSPHGRMALAVLIFQDIIVVPMILVTPLLAGEVANLGKSLGFLALKGIGVFALVAVSARWIVPGLFYQIARSRSRELFLLSVLVMCFGVAWLTYLAGLSLALGAFLAGLIISESDYGYHALGNIVPFRDVFTSLFFVSIGMLLDLGFLIKQPDQVALITVAAIIAKTFIATVAVLLLGFPLRTAIIAGLTLCQVGEFSFILARFGVDYGLLVGDTFQLFLAVAVITMGVTPFIMALAPKAADVTLRLPLPARLKTGFSTRSESVSAQQVRELADHLIIVGYGLNGRNVAMAAKTAKIPYVILEMNPETLRREKKSGELIMYGDATHEAVLIHAGIEKARVVVVAISDPTATRKITAVARRLNHKIHIIARTRFFVETAPLYELGANEVIAEEYETSVEIFARVLAKYLVPKEEIDRFTAETRKGGYEMFRKPAQDAPSLADLELSYPDLEISSIRVSAKAAIVGKSLAELQLRSNYRVNLLAIRRGSQILANPDGQTQILENDILILLGSPADLVPVAGSCLECDG